MIRPPYFRRCVCLLAQSVRCNSTFDSHLPKPNIINSSLSSVEIPNVTVPQYVYENFHKFPNKIGVECAATGRKYTFEEIKTKSDKLRKAIRKVLNLQKGDVIALLLPNVPEFPICVLGSLEAGLTVTTINPTYTAVEVKYQLLDSNAKAIITLTSLNPLAQAVTKDIDSKIAIVNIKNEPTENLPVGAMNFEELVNIDIKIDEAEVDDASSTAFLLYSSGTTGLPKGVQLSHQNVVSNLCQTSHPLLKIAHDTSETDQDVVPGILPWFHVAGLNSVMLLYMRYLCKLVSLPKFTPELFLKTLLTQKPHLLLIAPPIVSFMANHNAIKKVHLQPIRSIVCGAAPLDRNDEEKLGLKSGKHLNILQAYGLTEASPFILATSAVRKKAIGFSGSVGEVLPNTMVKVVPPDNPHAPSLGPNLPGELLVKGPQVAVGYYNKPNDTNISFVNGWLRTGDLVYYDTNKMFYFQDRLKELIKVKGFQVAPAELEELIRAFPDIADAAVIGVPSQRFGEVPHAYVVVKPDRILNTEKLLQHVSSNVAEYKTLKGGITVIDSIPKNASGKILRRELKLQYQSDNR
ncbi:hypothetical protein PPYR_06858 [Photinus pyralis]|uniref:AMP-dependent synthetase/ligase domain-containing protein n=1 Tax=Photinus pyralis TaxID=7054 RepID=A0A5N4AP34_PHOPY|nr:probable 4-coumarate--CoA ligase 1 [Photinus pyralis]KAB0798978.1 hypothetical protein PPYR_06858 [Photinus pyralis]